MPSTNISVEAFEFRGKVYNINIDCEYSWENDGIGSYEYWGAKGFDKGNTYAEAEDWSIDAFEVSEDGNEVAVSDKEILKELQLAVDNIILTHLENLEPDNDGSED